MDIDFHENLPWLFPHNPAMKDYFTDEVAREVMGVEQFRPEMYDDDYGSVALDLGYVLPSLMASFEPRPAAASAPDGADPTLLADDSAASSRLV